ncbi:MAG: class I SAM-dependent methyltransferase [Fusobacteriaceae bacterium]
MKLTLKEVRDIVEISIKENQLIKIIYSSSLRKNEYTKITVKPIKIKDELTYQVEYFKDNKAYHKNFNSLECSSFLNDITDYFKNINIFTSEKEYSLIKNKDDFHGKIKIEKKTIEVKEHNNKKEYIIPVGTPIEFLIDLNIMDKNGNILKNSYNKFRQINRYLEFIRDVINELKEKKEITDSIKVVDFGSGKSYLTFVLYYYLKVLRKLNVEVIGLDLKKDVMNNCNDLAIKYGFTHLEFLHGDIKDFTKMKNVDLVFSLHACNNATDYAFIKGIELGAKAILAVPCCQNEFNKKITNSQSTSFKNDFSSIIEHGILLEKISSLLTDGFRANIMELCGYKSQVMEFIDTEHTPKNLLIKCIKEKASSTHLNIKKLECEKYMEYIGINPIFYELAKKYFVNF